MAWAVGSRSTLAERSSLTAVLASVAFGAAGLAMLEPAVHLEPGTSIEREISGTRRDVFEISLQEGQVAAIEVEQQSIDVIVELLGPADAAIIEADDEPGTGTAETLDVLSDTTATYQVSVRSSFARASAGAYRIRVAGVRAATERDRLLHDARRLRAEAARLRRLHRDPEAVPILTRALALAERALGANEVFVALLLKDVGAASAYMLDHTASRRDQSRAVDILTAKLGPDHQQTVRAEVGLASTLTWLGEYQLAERLLLDALPRQEAAFGAEHQMLAFTLESLGLLEQDRGDFEGAERAFRRAEAIVSKWLGTGGERFGILENDLGVLYLRQKNYAAAEPHLVRALAAQEKQLGAGHARLAEPLQNLGVVARQNGDYAAAENYYRRALDARERSVGLDHPLVAPILNNLANIYSAKGEYARSLELHHRALVIAETHASPLAQVVLSLGNIARTYAAIGDFTNALVYQSRVEAALESETVLNLAIGSERQKIAYLKTIGERTDRTISFHLQLQPDNPEAAKLAAGTLLRRKGRVLDAMGSTFAALRQHASSDDQALLDRLAEITARFARLSLAGRQQASIEANRRMLRELQDTSEGLEADISRRSGEFRAASQRVTLDAVLAAIPADAVLIEFVVYRPFDTKTPNPNAAYGPFRYAAYVIRRNNITGIDLGEAAALDRKIDAFRFALHDPRRADVETIARDLDRQIMQPIRAAAPAAARLLISPDGQLALVPFEALVDERGRYLVERYPVSYLSAGRDLLRMQIARSSGSDAVILADPLFGTPAPSRPRSSSDQRGSQRDPRRSVTNGADLSGVYFAPIAGTRYEAESIQSLLPGVTVLTGAAATESAVKQVHAPRILHIATHGFFLQNPQIDNPLLRSGLALAGANGAAGAKEDGILTALEAAQLDLWGTRLVTLSACDTGIGVVRNGDGVYGLRRSIFLAGAETLVMSLWPVSDGATREMMTAYYTGLTHGLGRGEALRQVQLAMLKRNSRRHPFYWASFIQAGEWASLDGRR
jgi:CHAT domain-containing protein/Tfp pilus assembly protein PilF